MLLEVDNISASLHKTVRKLNQGMTMLWECGKYFKIVLSTDKKLPQFTKKICFFIIWTRLCLCIVGCCFGNRDPGSCDSLF